MNKLSIGIILLFSYVLFYHIGDEEYIKMLVLTLVTGIVVCYLNKNVEGLENSNGSDNSNGSVDSDNFGQASSDPATPVVKDSPPPTRKSSVSVTPIDTSLRMGPYDGLCVRTLNQKFKDLSKNKLISNNKLMTYQGVQGPIQNMISDDSALSGPNVDGDPNSPQRLFMFANNEASLNCCPSTYSSDRGCVCSTEKQDKFIRRRGFNNSAQNVA